MKVIALLPFKNEEWCLPSYLHNTTKIVDEIIAIDDGSTDNSVKILEDAGAKVYSSEKLINFNTFFSASGIITFKNSIDLQNTFKIIPLERLLIETDSPYLAPVPNRGKKNEPSFIKYTAEKLATIKDISYSEIVENTTDNFNNLFYKQ